MHEQVGLFGMDLVPPPGQGPVTAEFEFPSRPSHQVGVDAYEDAGEHRAGEPPVVVRPSSNDGVEPSGQLLETGTGLSVEPPPPDRATHGLERFLAHRWDEPDELPTVGHPHRTWRERVAQERERPVLEALPPLRSGVLAVHDLRLVRVQLEPDLFHPAADIAQQDLRVAFSGRVHDDVVHIPGKPHPGMLAGHPCVEGVVQEQVRQHRGNCRP